MFDAQRIWQETREGKRVQDRLAKFRDQKQAQVSDKEKELTDLQNQLSTQGLALSQEKRAALEKKIQKKVLELNQLRETATKELQLEVNEAEGQFREQLLALVERFGRDEGFTLILERSLVAYADPAVDVTTSVIDRFDKMVPAPPSETGKGSEGGKSGTAGTGAQSGTGGGGD